jgi:hypothetical protein
MGLHEPSRFLTLIESEQWAAVLSQLGRGSGQQLLAMLMREVPGPEVATLLRQVQADASQAVTPRVVTPYGGIFLLVPAIVDMGLHNFLQRCPYPEPPDMSKVGLLLFVIALQCLGRQNLEQAQCDGGLALFAGLPTAPTLAQLTHYAETLTPDMHEACSEMLQAYQVEVSRHPGMIRSSQGWSAGGAEHVEQLLLSSEQESLPLDRDWDGILARVSAAVLSGFASRLGAFAASSPGFLRRNFLDSRAEVALSADRITVRFLTCPLQMVLRMAGFDHTTWTVPWLEDRELAFLFD